MVMVLRVCLGLLFSSVVLAQQRPSILRGFLSEVLKEAAEGRPEPPDQSRVLPEYDFIVVGAGTAGCVLANRLSAVSKWKVLLIEAGREEIFLMDIPIVANLLQFSEANWKYRTMPSEKACLGMTDHRCNYPRGKVMGGSSVLNYMIYTRGHREDYDQWKKLGNLGWGYDDLMPYFLRLEDMAVPELAEDSTHHNVGGPVTMSYIPYRSPPAQAFVEGGVELGNPLRDYNADAMTGFSFLQVTMRNGTRLSSNHAYLSPIKGRRNLHVSKQSHVTRVLIDPATKTAYGVEFVRGGRRHVVRARREVVLAAGAINSPQVLMLSGVGPKKHLKGKGIPVIADLPVGYNLMDHVSAGGIMFTVNGSYGFSANRVIDNLDYISDYASYRQGPMTLPGGAEAVAFLDLPRGNDTAGWPDLELLFASGSLLTEPLLRDNFGIDKKLYDQVYAPYAGTDSFMVMPMLLRPKSKGRIKLSSASPLAKPAIYHNYFDDPEDLEVLVDGVLKTIEVAKTKAMARVGTKLFDVPLPGCAVHKFGSRDYWRCHIRHLPFTIYHHSGSCRMGPPSDRRSVVDSRLRVIGIKNLRVADASIMPEIPAAHTNTPTNMIAEKAADMIKEDNGVRVRRMVWRH